MASMTKIPTVGDWLTTAPWKDRFVSILAIAEMTQGHTLADKRELIDYPSSDLVVLWTGKYRTDARRVTPDEAAEIRLLLV